MEEKIKKYKKINKGLKIAFWIILFIVIGITSWILYRMYWNPENAVSIMKLNIYQEQKLEKVQRKAYTVVEWGGTEVR